VYNIDWLGLVDENFDDDDYDRNDQRNGLDTVACVDVDVDVDVDNVDAVVVEYLHMLVVC
jgi:hypothetical protein